MKIRVSAISDPSPSIWCVLGAIPQNLCDTTDLQIPSILFALSKMRCKRRFRKIARIECVIIGDIAKGIK